MLGFNFLSDPVNRAFSLRTHGCTGHCQIRNSHQPGTTVIKGGRLYSPKSSTGFLWEFCSDSWCSRFARLPLWKSFLQNGIIPSCSCRQPMLGMAALLGPFPLAYGIPGSRRQSQASLLTEVVYVGKLPWSYEEKSSIGNGKWSSLVGQKVQVLLDWLWRVPRLG